MPQRQTSLRLEPEDRVIFGAIVRNLRETHPSMTFNGTIKWLLRYAAAQLKILPTPAVIKRAIKRLEKKEGAA